jgi:hypothetical protein
MIDHPDTLGGPHFDRGLFGADRRLLRLHKGPKPQDPTPGQLKLEKEQTKLVEAQLAEMERQRLTPTPEAPKPLAPLPPPGGRKTIRA